MPRLLLALILCVVTNAHAFDTFTFSNPPGPHAVGVKVVQQYDRTRLFKMRTDLVTGEPAQGNGRGRCRRWSGTRPCMGGNR